MPKRTKRSQKKRRPHDAKPEENPVSGSERVAGGVVPISEDAVLVWKWEDEGGDGNSARS